MLLLSWNWKTWKVVYESCGLILWLNCSEFVSFFFYHWMEKTIDSSKYLLFIFCKESKSYRAATWGLLNYDHRIILFFWKTIHLYYYTATLHLLLNSPSHSVAVYVTMYCSLLYIINCLSITKGAVLSKISQMQWAVSR